MLIQNKQIAIVGGGPGGLTLARLLQFKGADVKVYERDFNKDERLIGSPFDLHEESGMAAIRQANLLNESMTAVAALAGATLALQSICVFLILNLIKQAIHPTSLFNRFSFYGLAAICLKITLRPRIS